MARPQKNSCDYFPLDADMRNHRKVKSIRNKFGIAGYGIWVMLLEYLTGIDGNEFEYSDLEFELMSGDFGVSVTEIRGVIDYCIRLEMLFNVNNFIYSESLNERLLPVYLKRGKSREISDKQKRLNGKFIKSADCTVVSVTETPQSKVDNIKVDNIKENETLNSVECADAPPPLKNDFIFKIIDEEQIVVDSIVQPTPSQRKEIDKKEKIKSVAKIAFDEKKCIYSNEFKKVWLELCGMPKWIKKPQTAINKSLQQIMQYPEDFAIQLCNNAIAGDYKGLVFPDTKQKYENQQKIKQNGQFNTHKPASIYQPEHVKRANERDAWEAKALQILATKHNQNTDSQLLIE